MYTIVHWFGSNMRDLDLVTKLTNMSLVQDIGPLRYIKGCMQKKGLLKAEQKVIKLLDMHFYHINTAAIVLEVNK